MIKKRLIACFLIHNNILVQSFNFRRYLPVGKLQYSLEFINRWGIDEIVVLDITPNRIAPNIDLIKEISTFCTVPLTYGGGIKSLAHAKLVFKNGADKVSLNSMAYKEPFVIKQLAEYFGSQSIVVSVDGIKTDGGFRTFLRNSDPGKNKLVSDSIELYQKMDAGEIFLNSVDRDGSRLGFDLEMIKAIRKTVHVPLIICGGAGKYNDFCQVWEEPCISGAAAANIFLHTEQSIITSKSNLLRDHDNVRKDIGFNYAFDGTDAKFRTFIKEQKH